MMSFNAQQKANTQRKWLNIRGGNTVAKLLPIFCFGLLLCEMKCLDSVVSRAFQGVHFFNTFLHVPGCTEASWR